MGVEPGAGLPGRRRLSARPHRARCELPLCCASSWADRRPPPTSKRHLLCDLRAPPVCRTGGSDPQCGGSMTKQRLSRCMRRRDFHCPVAFGSICRCRHPQASSGGELRTERCGTPTAPVADYLGPRALRAPLQYTRALTGFTAYTCKMVDLEGKTCSELRKECESLFHECEVCWILCPTSSHRVGRAIGCLRMSFSACVCHRNRALHRLCTLCSCLIPPNDQMHAGVALAAQALRMKRRSPCWGVPKSSPRGWRTRVQHSFICSSRYATRRRGRNEQPLHRHF